MRIQRSVDVAHDVWRARALHARRRAWSVARSGGPPSPRPASAVPSLGPGRPSLGLLACLMVGFGLASAREAPAQQPGAEARADTARPVSPDSADRLRAALERPPGEPPTDALDLLSVPLKAVGVPAELAAYAVQGLLWWQFRPGPPNPVLVALRDAQTWGLETEVSGFGPRGGVGGGVRLARFDPFFAESGISVRGSQRHALGLELGPDGERWAVRAAAGFRRFAEPHFWGIGPRSDEDAEADYRWDRWSLRGVAGVATGPVTWLAGFGWEENRVGRGSDGSEPDLVDVADPDTLFGLVRPTRYLRPRVGASVDLTRRRGFQTRGFRAALSGTGFLGVGGTPSDFARWSAEAVGYLPLNQRQQLALRGQVELNRPWAGRGIPFTHLASLGGSPNLRARDRDRFRDRDLVALTSEWRYEVWRDKRGAARAEGMLFLDAGTVARRIDRLDASDLKTDYGFGMRAVMGDELALLWYLGFGGGESDFGIEFSWPF